MRFRVRELREEKMISQEELAKKSGVSRGIIVALESGREIVTSTKTLERISFALEKKVSDIFLE